MSEVETNEKKPKKKYPSHNRACIRYQAANTKRVAFDLNKNTRPRMLAYLESVDNVNGYLKHLIAVDMKGKGITTDGMDGE